MVKDLLTLIRRYQLTLRSGLALIGLGVISFLISFQLVTTSMEKARSIKGEFLERDLRELVGRYEADERFTLEQNLGKLLSDEREVTPLLLPRSYYASLSAGDRAPPRQPPRNCFVMLSAAHARKSADLAARDKVCPYFVKNKALGKFLFLSATVVDDSVSALKTGDSKFNADMLRVKITSGTNVVSWWLALQQPRDSKVLKGRYELTAFREISENSHELDKRVEGWAYTQRQADGSNVLHLIARINFNEFEQSLSTKLAAEEWPLPGWQDIKLTFGKRDAREGSLQPRDFAYDAPGASNLSIVSLADQIYKAHAKLVIQKRNFDGKNVALAVPEPITKERYKADLKFGPIAVVDGDLFRLYAVYSGTGRPAR